MYTSLQLKLWCVAFTNMFVLSSDLQIIAGKDFGALCNAETVDVI